MNATYEAADCDRLCREVAAARQQMGSALLSKDRARIAQQAVVLTRALDAHMAAYLRYRQKIQFMQFERQGGFT